MLGGLGGLANLPGLLKQARQMKEQMEQMQAEMEGRQYSAAAGGSLVTATVNGRGDLVGLKISPDAVGDVAMLEDLVKAAVGAASAKARDAMQQEMAKLTGGLNLGGLTDMLGGMGK